MALLRRPVGIALLCLACLNAADLTISRPVRAWEFLDVTGPQASLLGREDGTLEAYVYPLKIFKDLRLRFRVDNRLIPGASIARRIVSEPGAYTLIYSGDEFEVRETLAASADLPGAVIRLEVSSHAPLGIEVEFTRDFQAMWPASIGTSYGEWNPQEHAMFFGADGQPFAAVLGSPDAVIQDRDYGTNYSSEATTVLSLGTVQGKAVRVLALAGSMKSRAEAMDVYRRILAAPPAVIAAARQRNQDYLARTISVDLPDPALQAAYDWSRLSMMHGMVENPLLGTGLVAGYGPSKGAYRPGFAWFFGRDTFWTTFALTAAGDLANAKTAIEFIAKYQRADGKMPHEIAQSASLVSWFENYPYGYASADATPLYVIAVRNYVEASGDIAFARASLPRLNRAFAFMRANFEANGFPKNFANGHGWVEGGPLLPVQVELYQAGCYVEALRSMAALAQLTGDAALAGTLTSEFEAKRKVMEDRFWLPQAHTYAFALDTANRPVDQPSVLSTVPMWFGLLDPKNALEMIDRLSAEDHAADWGMRIISTQNPLFAPDGYHFGSIWPLFTGWASVGEYRYHAAASAYANLRANAWLALDGAGGHSTEVLSGLTYAALSTASPHQIWSAAMVVSPLLRGLCGLNIDVPRKTVTFAPHLPAEWNTLGIRGALLDFALERTATELRLEIENHGADPLTIDFAPAYAPTARVITPGYREERSAVDWHPHFTLKATPGTTKFTIAHRGLFGYAVPYLPPELGAPSVNLKVTAERWTPQQLQLTLSGRALTLYRIPLLGAAEVTSVEQATLDAGTLLVDMPKGEGYVSRTVTIHLRTPPR